jgi:hypothetical protein
MRHWSALIAGALLFAGAPLLAQETRPSEPIPIDSLAYGIAPADTIPVLARRFRESEGAEVLAAVPSEDVLPKNPRNAAIRAFLIPGWGQVYTGHPIRGVFFAVSEVVFLVYARKKQQDVEDTRDEINADREAFFADTTLPEDPATQEQLYLQTQRASQLLGDLEYHRARRADFYAWAGASVLFAAVDAYVSAQLDPLEVGADVAERRAWVGLRFPVGRQPGERR